MKKETNTLNLHPKLNYIRVRTTIHKKKNSADIAVSYTDAHGIIHRTSPCRSLGHAQAKLKQYLFMSTGIGKVSLVAVEEVLES